MIRVVVVQAAGLKWTTFVVLTLLDDVERPRVNPLHKVPQEQRISPEAGRIPDNVRLSLAGRRVSATLNSKKFWVALLL